jgi:hypothetical protein
MKLKNLLILCIGFAFIGQLSAQADLDYTNTIALSAFEGMFNESTFAYPDFVQANIHQNKNSSKKAGIIQNKMINYDRASNSFYVLEDGNIYKLNNDALQGVYVNRGHQFLKVNNNQPNAICELVYMTEKIYVYLIGDKTYAKVGNEDLEMERTCDSIEKTFNISSKSINKYIAINGLKPENIEDFKLILRQYENSFYNERI